MKGLNHSNIIKISEALARWLNWLEHHPIHQNVVGSILGQGDTERYDQITGGEVVRGCRRRLPKAMVNSLGWDWLRSRLLPEHMELWARRLKRRALVLSGLLALCLFLGDAWVVVLQLPAFPNG